MSSTYYNVSGCLAFYDVAQQTTVAATSTNVALATLNDVSGNGNTAVGINSPLLVQNFSGAGRHAVYLNGSAGSCMNLPSGVAFSETSGFTIVSTWQTTRGYNNGGLPAWQLSAGDLHIYSGGQGSHTYKANANNAYTHPTAIPGTERLGFQIFRFRCLVRQEDHLTAAAAPRHVS